MPALTNKSQLSVTSSASRYSIPVGQWTALDCKFDGIEGVRSQSDTGKATVPYPLSPLSPSRILSIVVEEKPRWRHRRRQQVFLSAHELRCDTLYIYLPAWLTRWLLMSATRRCLWHTPAPARAATLNFRIHHFQIPNFDNRNNNSEKSGESFR